MSVLQDFAGLRRFRIVQLLALTALMAGVGSACLYTKLSVLDNDIWWHLAVGDWIVQRRAVPHTGIFSHTAANHPWTAYSWGYEVMLSRAYVWFGFIGMALFGVVLTLAVAATLFWMLRRLSNRFWVAWLLTIIVIPAFLFSIMPRPVFFSMLLFAITLTLILEAQRSGRTRLLHWLPLVFLLWANLHIQFVYGLFALGLLVTINLLQRIAISLGVEPDFLLPPTLPLPELLGVLVVCALASCVGPYTFHLYQEVFQLSQSKVLYRMITELQSLSFEGFSHFFELLLAAGAFFAVGWRKKLDLFKLALLIAASIFAFRTTRDAWFICISAGAVIGDFPAPKGERDEPFKLSECAGMALILTLLLFLVARNTDFNSRGVDRAISSQFPVDAANFLRKNPVAGPLYNSFDFGGFLIFYMPQYPVAIDGRTGIYGDKLLAEFYDTEAADVSYAKDPFLNEAGVVILKNSVPLAKLLPTDPRFRVIYHDEIAVVLARN